MKTRSILKDEGAEETGGVMHCFSGSAKTAEELLELGFYLSLPESSRSPRPMQ